MAAITVDVNWEIQPARETQAHDAKRFDQTRQSDQPFGPEPDNPSGGPPETGGGGDR